MAEKSSTDQILKALDIACQHVAHAEIVTQARLYNFLFSNSIPILAWASVFAAKSGNLSWSIRFVLCTLAGISIVLSLAYAIVGHRGNKFVEMIFDVAGSVESQLPQELHIMKYTVALQKGKVYRPKINRNDIALSKLEQSPLIHGHLLESSPITLAITSLILLLISIFSS